MIKENDHFILYIDRELSYFVKLEKDWTLDTKFGWFGFDEIIQKEYGSKISSKN